MPQVEALPAIPDVLSVLLKTHRDQRGQFLEFFRKEWFPQRSWDIVQMNRSDSTAGTLRGLHYHHRQVDYWYVANGSIRVGLADLRSWSDSYLTATTLDLAASEAKGLFLPVGVAHGYLALTDATVFYVVDNYYDGGDELGVAWNDPELGLRWGNDHPVLSPRDRDNPRLQDIAPQLLPGR